jgi:hypothetical protein
MEIPPISMDFISFRRTRLLNDSLRRGIIQSWYSGAFKLELIWQVMRSNAAHLTAIVNRVENRSRSEAWGLKSPKSHCYQ